MELRTAKSHYTFFCMILAGIIIGLLVGSWGEKPMSYAVSIVAAAILLPSMFFRIILSVNIVNEQLVVESMNLFRKKTTRFNIREIELQLMYMPPRCRRPARYGICIKKGGEVQNVIVNDEKKLAAFIDEYQQMRQTI